MGGRKFEISRLANIRKRIVGAAKDNEYYNNDDFKFSCQVCVDWNEFNKLYFSKRHSVIQCPVISNRTESGINTISLYAAMKMAFDLKKVNIIMNDGIFNLVKYQVNEFYNEIIPNKNTYELNERLTAFSTYSTKLLSSIRNCDEIVVIPFTYSRNSRNILNFTDSKWLLHFIDYTLNELFKSENRDVKLTILAHDSKAKDDDGEVLYDELKKRFPDFLYFDYTNEKKFVDDWFVSNDTLVDPVFDIKVTDPTLDKNKVWRYIATNHKYKFREYCKFDKEFVLKNMSMNELKEYGIF